MLKLTVAIPAYNVSQWLEGTLASILACDSDEYEILVIDDGSTDETPKIAQRYQMEHPKLVRYVRKENGHYGSVINRAIREARGLFLRIVDGDDYVNPEGLADLLNSIDADKAPDLILCDYRRVYISEGQDQVCKAGMAPGMHMVDGLQKIPNFKMHAAVYRVELLVEKDIRLTEGVPYTDEEYVLFPMPFVQSIMYCPVEVYQYRIGVEGQSVSPENAIKLIDSHWRVLNVVCEWVGQLDTTKLENSVRDFIAFRVIHLAVDHIWRAVMLDTEAARKKLLMIDDLINSVPLLKQNDCRGKLIKLFWLMKLGNYRFLPVWKALKAAYGAIKKALGIKK